MVQREHALPRICKEHALDRYRNLHVMVKMHIMKPRTKRLPACSIVCLLA
jgi:hypothetical protein